MAALEEGSEEKETRRRALEAQKIYGRGRKIVTKNVKDKKLRSNLKLLETKYKDATLKARDAEILLENESGFLETEGELERTYKVRQDELRKDIAVETAKKVFELKLQGLGPYTADYTRNGRGLLLAGRKGHVATMDWRGGELGCELQFQETVRDAKWLHNDQYFAVAQKKHVFSKARRLRGYVIPNLDMIHSLRSEWSRDTLFTTAYRSHKYELPSIPFSSCYSGKIRTFCTAEEASANLVGKCWLS